jgi:hypothetical protein
VTPHQKAKGNKKMRRTIPVGKKDKDSSSEYFLRRNFAIFTEHLAILR